MALYWHVASFFIYSESSVVICKALTILPMFKVTDCDRLELPSADLLLIDWVIGAGDGAGNFFLVDLRVLEDVLFLVGSGSDQLPPHVRVR